jgi:tetratricopeptide (TPR) repeat protein
VSWAAAGLRLIQMAFLFVDNEIGYAVVGTCTEDRFEELEPTFRSVAGRLPARPGGGSMSDAELASAQFRAIGAAYGEVDPVAAEDAFRRSLQLEPGVAVAHAALAEVLTRLNRYAEAASHLRRALTLDPQQEQALALQMELLGRGGPRARGDRALRAPPRANGASARIITLVRRPARPARAARGRRPARYREALRCGGTPEAHANLALLAVDDGRFDGGPGGLRPCAQARPDARRGAPEPRERPGRARPARRRGGTVLRADRRSRRRRCGWWGLAADPRRPRRLRRGDRRPAARVQTDPELARRCATAPVGA